MKITIKRHDISAKFYQVHAGTIDGWLRAYLAGDAPPHFNILPRKPMASPSLSDMAGVDDVVTIAALLIKETKRYDRGGLIERYLVVGPDDRSRAVIDQWEREHEKLSAADILWFPSFDNLEAKDAAGC